MGKPFPFMALIKRELLVSLRSAGLYACLLVLLAVFFLFILALWPRNDFLAGGAATASRGIYEVFCITMMVGAALLMPGLAAGSMAAERDEGTYDQLHLTLIRPWGIVAAKLANTLGIFLLFYVAALPVLATVLFLVGMDLLQLLLAATVILATGITCACLGLAAGAVCRSTVRATLAAYLLMLAYMGLPILLIIVVLAVVDETTGLDLSRPGLWMIGALRDYTPPGVLDRATRGSLVGTEFLGLVALSLGLSSVCLVFSINRLRRPLEAPEKPPMSRPRTPGARRLRASRGIFPDHVNPVMARELLHAGRRRPRLFGGLTVGLIGFFTLVSVATVSFSNTFSIMEAMLVPLVLQMACVLLAAPALVANTLTKERERDTLDLLRTTLLTPGEVVSGKVIAGFQLLRPLLVAEIIGLFPLFTRSLLMPNSWRLLFMACGTLAVTAVLSIALATLASAMTDRTVRAIVHAYSLNALVFALIPLALLMLVLNTYGYVNEDDIMPVAGFLSPPLAFLVAADTTIYSASELRPLGGIAGALVYWGANVATHLAFAGACLVLATRLFAQRTGRKG